MFVFISECQDVMRFIKTRLLRHYDETLLSAQQNQ